MRLDIHGVVPPKQSLAPSLAELMAECRDNLPVWIRPPTRGRERFTGLTRSALYSLAGAGKILTASLRPAGKMRGIRLFHLGSVLAFIDANRIETHSHAPQKE